MKTIIADLTADSLKQAGQILRGGGLVAFPTETVYGLGGDALQPEASRKIYAAKGRPSDNPLIVHIAYPEEAEPLAETNELYYRLADAFMPGPLTVILPKKDCVPSETTGGLSSVALRCPAHAGAHALLVEAGVPIAAPSANLSGSPSPTCAAHVIHDLDGRVDMILDGGESEVGVESTIVKIEGDSLLLLRPGGITVEDLRRVTPQVTVAPAVTGRLAEGERPLSPGMKYRHYAPRAPLTLLDGDYTARLCFMREQAHRAEVALICPDEMAEEIGPCTARVFRCGHETDMASQAHRLFAALREADASGAAEIYAAKPGTEGIGLALYNRLIRASAYHIRQL